MKNYNVEGYVRHKLELEAALNRIEEDIVIDETGNIDYTDMTDKTIILCGCRCAKLLQESLQHHNKRQA